MSGGGVGGALGAGLGMLLAPETGGASLLIPAGLGALGGAAGAGLTGGNPLTSGLLGGAGGLAGGFLSGLLSPGADAVGDIGDLPGAGIPPLDVTAADASSISNPLDMETLAGTPSVDAGASTSLNNAVAPAASSGNSGSFLDNLFGGSSSSQSAPPGGWGKVNPITGGTNAAAPSGSGISGLLSKQNLMLGGLGLGALSALFPGGSNPINVGGTAASVQATNPGFNASLPKYNFNSAQTPYTGNWYTYGQRPESPLIQNSVTPMARGGLAMRHFAEGGQNSAKFPSMPQMKNMSVADIVRALPRNVIPGASVPSVPFPPRKPPIPPTSGPTEPLYGGYAMGGRVRHLALGGPPMQAPMGPAMPPQGAPPMGMPPQMPQRAAPPNPMAEAAKFAIGKKLGSALRGHIQKQGIFSKDGIVNGPGGGQDDAVPARLSRDEFVIPADVTSMLGDGSSRAGGEALEKMVHHVRAHKATKHFPPKAHKPLQYLRRR